MEQVSEREVFELLASMNGPRESFEQKCQRVMDEQGFLVVAWPNCFPGNPSPGKAIPPGSLRAGFWGGEILDVTVMCVGLATREEWHMQCAAYAGNLNPIEPYGTMYFKVVAE